jgi:hypothetical protein
VVSAGKKKVFLKDADLENLSPEIKPTTYFSALFSLMRMTVFQRGDNLTL